MISFKEYLKIKQKEILKLFEAAGLSVKSELSVDIPWSYYAHPDVVNAIISKNITDESLIKSNGTIKITKKYMKSRDIKPIYTNIIHKINDNQSIVYRIELLFSDKPQYEEHETKRKNNIITKASILVLFLNKNKRVVLKKYVNINLMGNLFKDDIYNQYTTRPTYKGTCKERDRDPNSVILNSLDSAGKQYCISITLDEIKNIIQNKIDGIEDEKIQEIPEITDLDMRRAFCDAWNDSNSTANKCMLSQKTIYLNNLQEPNENNEIIREVFMPSLIKILEYLSKIIKTNIPINMIYELKIDEKLNEIFNDIFVPNTKGYVPQFIDITKTKRRRMVLNSGLNQLQFLDLVKKYGRNIWGYIEFTSAIGGKENKGQEYSEEDKKKIIASDKIKPGTFGKKATKEYNLNVKNAKSFLNMLKIKSEKDDKYKKKYEEINKKLNNIITDFTKSDEIKKINAELYGIIHYS